MPPLLLAHFNEPCSHQHKTTELTLSYSRDLSCNHKENSNGNPNLSGQTERRSQVKEQGLKGRSTNPNLTLTLNLAPLEVMAAEARAVEEVRVQMQHMRAESAALGIAPGGNRGANCELEELPREGGARGELGGGKLLQYATAQALRLQAGDRDGPTEGGTVRGSNGQGWVRSSEQGRVVGGAGAVHGGSTGQDEVHSSGQDEVRWKQHEMLSKVSQTLAVWGPDAWLSECLIHHRSWTAH